MSDDENQSGKPDKMTIYRYYRTQRLSHDPEQLSSTNESNSDSQGWDAFEVEAVKYELSWRHQESAAFFFREAERIEQAFKNNDVNGLNTEDELPPGNRHDAFVVNSIISSVSYLEAIVNEFYKSKSELARNGFDNETIAGNSDWADAQFYNQLEHLSATEERSFEYKSTLKKYQLLLIYAGNEPLSAGEGSYQKVQNVCGLRNHFIHHEPEWVNPPQSPDEDPHRLVASLQGKFELNPLAGDNMLEFPDKYLSAGCAKWCYESVKELIDDFYERIGARTPPHHGLEFESD